MTDVDCSTNIFVSDGVKKGPIASSFLPNILVLVLKFAHMSSICRIFTKSASRPVHSIHCDVLQSVCLSINVLKPCFTLDWRHLVKECIANIDIYITSLLCIVGELAVGGSVAVAVGVTHETQNIICDT